MNNDDLLLSILASNLEISRAKYKKCIELNFDKEIYIYFAESKEIQRQIVLLKQLMELKNQ